MQFESERRLGCCVPYWHWGMLGLASAMKSPTVLRPGPLGRARRTKRRHAQHVKISIRRTSRLQIDLSQSSGTLRGLKDSRWLSILAARR